MTLNDFQGNSPIASLFMCKFLYSCAAVDKLSSDLARHVVFLR